MNHLYFEEEKVSAFARVLARTGPFTEGPFLLYRDVPLGALTCEAPFFQSTRNLETMDAHTALQSVDWLVCKGENPVLGITFDFDPRDSRQIFRTILRGVHYIAVKATDLQEQDFHIHALLKQVLETMSEAVPSEFILREISSPAVRDFSELQRMGLINRNGYISRYGKDCGLFFSWRADETGTVSERPAFAGKRWNEYMNAVNFSAEGRTDLLSELLECRLSEFYSDHIRQWSQMVQTVTDATAQKVCPANAPFETVADLLAILNHVPDEDSAPFRKQLLGCILPVLCSPEIHNRFRIFNQPLREFCAETARMTGSYYPVWFYNRHLSHYFNGSAGKLSFSDAWHYANSTDVSVLKSDLSELLTYCITEV